MLSVGLNESTGNGEITANFLVEMVNTDAHAKQNFSSTEFISISLVKTTVFRR